MKKQFTILLILIFILGLMPINFIRYVKASNISTPIAYWDFNNSDEIKSGLVRDKYGNYNGINYNNTWAGDGYDNGAMLFNSISSSNSWENNAGIKISNLPEMSQITLLYRIKLNNSIQANLNNLISTNWNFNTSIINDTVGCGFSGGSLEYKINIDDQWHQFAFTYDGQTVSLYIDGVLKKISTSPWIGKTAEGIWSFGSTYKGGFTNPELYLINPILVDEIKIYNKVLNEEEILYEYENNQLCSSDTWGCENWNICSINGQQTRVCSKIFNCPLVDTPSPSITQSCIPECTEDTWSCSNWGTCSSNGQQTRNCNKTFDCSLTDMPSPATGQSCSYIPPCVSSDWSCSGWGVCSSSGVQTKTCTKISNCRGGILSPSTTQSCSYVPACNSYSWSCGSWGACLLNGTKIRECNKISNCEGGTQLPAITQSCTYTPVCSVDTWQCSNWGTCSPQGVQTRSCTRAYDCPSVETAAPATSQYCEAPNQPKQQTPSENLGIVNQDTIIKATVKLICPVSATMASQGSGTVINSTGLILTNKHVIDGTAGCWVGFIDDYDDEPYFGDRQIADIYKVSSDADAAVLKLRNPNNKTLTSINISQSNSSNIKLGEILTTYGYPAKFGIKITYTSGDFSGVDGDYLKTTAIIEHGNSGGGAYLKNGAFIGIPTAVIKGSLNSMGYLLSVNKVNSWLNNSVAYNNNSGNNNYSRVSAMLEDMDLNTLGSLGLFVAGDEANITTQTESQKVITEEKSLITKIDKNLSKRVSGNILLQVEKNGEGWYVYPNDKKKYYLGRPADAFGIMKNLGLGIKHSELANYLNAKFPSRLSGKILLDVEQNGEAYYINPKDFKGYYLNRPSDAFRIMRELGLGITNSDVRKIDVGEMK